MIRNSYCLGFSLYFITNYFGLGSRYFGVGGKVLGIRVLSYCHVWCTPPRSPSTPIIHRRPSPGSLIISAHRYVVGSSAPIATVFVHRRPSPYSSFIGAHRHIVRSSAPIATVFVHRRPSPYSSFLGFSLMSMPAPLCMSFQTSNIKRFVFHFVRLKL